MKPAHEARGKEESVGNRRGMVNSESNTRDNPPEYGSAMNDISELTRCCPLVERQVPER